MNNFFEVGYTKPLMFGRLPVRFHWTIPFMCIMFSGLHFRPGLWVGVLLVIFIHELGHAFLVKRVGLMNLGIDLTGIGGVCRYAGRPTRVQRSIVAWGGVLAQLALLLVTWAVILLVDLPRNLYLQGFIDALTRANLFIMAFNLLPFGPLDGAEAWPLFRYLREDRQARRPKKRPGGPNLKVIDGGAKKDEPKKWLH